jgi:hypothetical protein
LQQQWIVRRGLVDKCPDILGRAHVRLGDVLLTLDGSRRLVEIDEAVLRRRRLDDRDWVAVLRREDAARPGARFAHVVVLGSGGVAGT